VREDAAIVSEDTGSGEREHGRLDLTNPFVRWGLRAWLTVGFLVAGWLLWRLAGHVRIVLFPLILALFPASVLRPLAERIGRVTNDTVGALVTTVGAVVAVIGVLALVGWQVSSQMGDLQEQLTSTWETAQQQIQRIPGLEDVSVGSFVGDDSGGSSSEGDSGGGADSGSGSGSSSGSSSSDGAGSGGGSLALRLVNSSFRFLAMLLLGLVATFFYIRDGHRIAGWVSHLFPRHRRDDAERVGSYVWETTSEYVRGQTFVAMFDGTFVAVGLLIAGVPLALALGVLVFIGAYIPVVGSILAGSVAVVIALVSGGVTKALIALAIVVAVQQIEGNVLAPIVLGRELEIHPLAVLAAVTAGAAVLGPFGAIVAVPLAASVNRSGRYLAEENG
jgi:predicted PurR-regulated permease PerM